MNVTYQWHTRMQVPYRHIVLCRVSLSGVVGVHAEVKFPLMFVCVDVYLPIYATHWQMNCFDWKIINQVKRCMSMHEHSYCT